MWRRGQRWALCSHRPRNAWNHQKLKEQRRTLSRAFVGSTDLLIPWFQTPSLQNLKRVYYYVLSLLFCGNLLWQPSETNTPLDSGLQGKATANTAHGEEARATWSTTYPSSHSLISHWMPLIGWTTLETRSKRSPVREFEDTRLWDMEQRRKEFVGKMENIGHNSDTINISL